MLLSAGTVRRSSDLTLAGCSGASVERLVQLTKNTLAGPLYLQYTMTVFARGTPQ